MLDKKRKAVIDSITEERRYNLGVHLYVIYWHQHAWTKKKWAADGWSDITADQLKLINLLASGESMSGSKLARRAHVTKQAMSQMVNLMEKRGVLVVQQDPDDSRVKMISLSAYGAKFLKYFSSYTKELNKQYTEIIGEDKMRMLTEITGELADVLIEENGMPKLGFTN
jgi:DNA-binding MarR family transcriptional regulator